MMITRCDSRRMRHMAGNAHVREPLSRTLLQVGMDRVDTALRRTSLLQSDSIAVSQLLRLQKSLCKVKSANQNAYRQSSPRVSGLWETAVIQATLKIPKIPERFHKRKGTIDRHGRVHEREIRSPIPLSPVAIRDSVEARSLSQCFVSDAVSAKPSNQILSFSPERKGEY
jgi:hypothetical protein